MHQYAALTIEIVDRFVISGRYREYMARICAANGCVIYSSGWDRSRKRVEERAKQAQRELERQARRSSTEEQMSYDEVLNCCIEIETEQTDAGIHYFARVRTGENGPILFQTNRCTDAFTVEYNARIYLQHLFRLASSTREE